LGEQKKKNEMLLEYNVELSMAGNECWTRAPGLPDTLVRGRHIVFTGLCPTVVMFHGCFWQHRPPYLKVGGKKWSKICI